jgi:hypothetical protein
MIYQRPDSMTDDPFYVRELLWTEQKGTDTQSAELRDHGKHGVELELLRNGEWFSGSHYVSRALALAEAWACRRQLEADGWIP